MVEGCRLGYRLGASDLFELLRIDCFWGVLMGLIARASCLQEPLQPAFSARIWFFGLGVLLNVLLSGALILGCTPFQDALVRRYGYSTADAGC